MSLNRDTRESPPAESEPENEPPLRELANALTALGNYLAAAKNAALSVGSESNLDPMLDKTVAQHQRAVRAVRQLRNGFLCGDLK